MAMAKRQPEAIIQKEIMNYLRLREWLVINIHGSIYSMGLPDLYACHSRYGSRFIEVKNPKYYSFTAAQLEIFPQLMSKGVGVWVLVAATEEEYKKLFKPANWHHYLDIMK
jgi:hypothetical protein